MSKDNVILDKEKLKEIDKRIDEQIDKLLKDKKLKFVKDQKDYWVKHKQYKKRIGVMFKPRYISIIWNRPYDFIFEYELILKEMTLVGLVTDDWANGQRERLIREIQTPAEFKGWVMWNKNKLRNMIN